MKIRTCSITRSLLHVHAWVFEIEINDYKFSGYFEDMGGFLTMVKECARFFAVRHGLMRVKDANLTRSVMPNHDLPGDKPQ